MYEQNDCVFISDPESIAGVKECSGNDSRFKLNYDSTWEKKFYLS